MINEILRIRIASGSYLDDNPTCQISLITKDSIGKSIDFDNEVIDRISSHDTYLDTPRTMPESEQPGRLSYQSGSVDIEMKNGLRYELCVNLQYDPNSARDNADGVPHYNLQTLCKKWKGTTLLDTEKIEIPSEVHIQPYRDVTIELSSNGKVFSSHSFSL